MSQVASTGGFASLENQLVILTKLLFHLAFLIEKARWLLTSVFIYFSSVVFWICLAKMLVKTPKLYQLMKSLNDWAFHPLRKPIAFLPHSYFRPRPERITRCNQIFFSSHFSSQFVFWPGIIVAYGPRLSSSTKCSSQ